MDNLTNEILARLQNGEAIEAIADEIAANINEANRLYSDKEDAKNAKLSDLALLLDNIHEFLDKYYPNSILNSKKVWDEITVTESAEALDKLVTEVGNLYKVIDKVADMTSLYNTNINSYDVEKDLQSDDVILKNFLAGLFEDN